MVDKMLRIAGRGRDGLAKAIGTDLDGRLDVRESKVIQITDPKPINSKATLTFGPYNTTEKYAFAIFYFDTKFEMRVYIAFHHWDPPTDSYVAGEYKEIIHNTSVGYRHSRIEIPLDSARFSIKVENYGVYGGYLGENNHIVLSDSERYLSERIEDIYSRSENLHRQLFKGSEVANGGNLRSRVLRSLGFNTTTLHIAREFPMRISVRYFEVRANGVETARPFQVIVETTQIKGDHFKVCIPLEYDKYQILIENIGTTNSYFTGDNFEVLSNEESLDKSKALTQETISRPKSRLYFRQTVPSIAVMSRSEDGLFYVVDQDGTLKTYTEITKNVEPSQTGLNFYTAIGKTKETASLVAIRVLGNDINYFANVDNKATIYHTKSINTIPTTVYQSADAGVMFSKSFGIDAYINGE